MTPLSASIDAPSFAGSAYVRSFPCDFVGAIESIAWAKAGSASSPAPAMPASAARAVERKKYARPTGHCPAHELLASGIGVGDLREKQVAHFESESTTLTNTIANHKSALTIELARMRVQAAAAPAPASTRRSRSVAVMIRAFPSNIALSAILIQNGTDTMYVLTSDAKKARPLSKQIASATTIVRWTICSSAR